MKRFILLFLLFVGVLLAVGAPIYLQYEKVLQQRMLANEETSVVAATQMIQKEMYEQLHLLDLLKNSAALKEYLSTGDPDKRVRLERLFENISGTYNRFDQIRVLDNSGHELIRVNLTQGEARVVPTDKLQDKSHRYYFQKARRLPVEQVFVSRMDLNMEQGVIEEPYKPVLRFATPLLDDKGNRAGVLVMNYMAADMLARFRQQMSRRLSQQGMLIDAKGYWLSNHQRSNEWGADLDRPEHIFSSLYPDAWPEISAQDGGVLEKPKGFFRFQSIAPLDFSKKILPEFLTDKKLQPSPGSINNTAWKLVIFLPRDVIRAQSFLYQTLGQSLLILLLLLMAGVALLMAVASEQKAARRRYHRRINAELSDLYEYAPCGYHSLDAQGHFIRINQTELNWLGYAREAVMGQPFVRFLTPESQQRFELFFNALKTELEIENIVLEMQCQDGSTFYVSTSATSLKDQKGHFAIARTSMFDITDRIKLEKKLEQLANTDELTGVGNRHYFYERGETELQRALRYRHSLALLMIDADHFKQINDAHGHDGGDLVLKALANSVQGSLRDLDVLARFGGEEFIVLLPEITQSQAIEVAERLRRQLKELAIPLPTGEQISFTVSVGLTMLISEDTNLDALIKRADIALYQAKEQGRNRVVSFNEGVSAAFF
ncbi:sensor domain-containing diguanylate cyclase [Oceanisphaera sp. KMM 10153]|uniref:sensor domain-containing diguanylate cyclase n=1 Tax=Oceanisphaera submarina TaxID=3390193 RepID=UPI003975819A